MYKLLNYILILTGIISQFSQFSYALTFTIPAKSNIVGNIQKVTVQYEESLSDIGKRFDVGVYEMIEANPNLDPWEPREGASVIVPTQFILPSSPREGIIINLAEMRLYFYNTKKNLVTTHPIGIGRKGWVTPLLEATIIDKKSNPTWHPPISIIKEHAKHGDILPSVIPPGPNNPLGNFAIYLSASGYLIHGTNRSGGIGLRTTSGCIRLYPEDIKSLYNQVSIGTKVKIIHEPYKIGIYNNQLYLEAHEPLSDPYYNQESINKTIKKAIKHICATHNIPLKNNFNLAYLEEMLEKLAKLSKGYPLLVTNGYTLLAGLDEVFEVYTESLAKNNNFLLYSATAQDS
jgi:L,D-transpeptidase ErfK/SrfK